MLGQSEMIQDFCAKRMELTRQAENSAVQSLISQHPILFRSRTPSFQEKRKVRVDRIEIIQPSLALVPKRNRPLTTSNVPENFHLDYSSARPQHNSALPRQNCLCESLSVGFLLLDGRRIFASCIYCSGITPEGSGS